MARFGLKTFFLFFAVSAVICAAFWSPTVWAASIASTAVVFLSGFAVLAAMYRRGEVQSQAVGFAVFCVFYAVLLLGWPHILPATTLFPQAVDNATMAAMKKQERQLKGVVKGEDTSLPAARAVQSQIDQMETDISRASAKRNRYVLAHCTSMIVIAWIGAHIASCLYRQGTTDSTRQLEANNN